MQNLVELGRYLTFCDYIVIITREFGSGNVKIAVCDDSSVYRKQIVSNLKRIEPIKDSICSEFASSEDLLNAYNAGEKFDIIFLDVEMNEINGIDAGIEIRKTDKTAIIIFVSSYPKYAIPAYECEAFYFIVKPINDVQFNKIVYKAIEKFKATHKYILVKSNGKLQKLYISDILYVEIYRKHLIFHTFADKFETLGKISETYIELICQVHQGYLVNMNYIKEFVNNDIVMTNGEKVMVSVRRKTEVLREYISFLEKVY